MLEEGFDFVTFLLIGEECEAGRLNCPGWLCEKKNVFAVYTRSACVAPPERYPRKYPVSKTSISLQL